MLRNIAQAYGGGIAGPIAVWTGLCLVLLLFILFKVRSGNSPRGNTLAAVLCLSWALHGVIIWYTVIRLLGLFLITELHIGRAAWRQEVLLMVDGSTRFALISTVSLIFATILSLFGIKHRVTTEPDRSSSPDSSITASNALP
jgi:hypothetical protein